MKLWQVLKRSASEIPLLVLIPGLTRYLTKLIVVDVSHSDFELIATGSNVRPNISMATREVKVSQIQPSCIIACIIIANLHSLRPIVFVPIDPERAMTRHYGLDSDHPSIRVSEPDLTRR